MKSEEIIKKEKKQTKGFEIISFQDFISRIKGKYTQEYKKKFNEIFTSEHSTFKNTIFIEKNTIKGNWGKIVKNFSDLRYPIVDKKLGIIFVANGNSHQLFTDILYAYHQGYSIDEIDKDKNDEIFRENFLNEGYGYYLSARRIKPKWQVGEKYSFDKNDYIFLDGEKIGNERFKNQEVKPKEISIEELIESQRSV